MATTSVVNVTGTKSGGLAGTQAIGPATITNTSSTEYTYALVLASGDNTLTIPANAVGFLFTPEAGNGNVLKLKKAAGDTGVQMHKTNTHMQSLDTAATSGGTYTVIINSSGAGTNPSVINYF